MNTYAIRTRPNMLETAVTAFCTFDTGCRLHPEGNPVTFWVETTLSADDVATLDELYPGVFVDFVNSTKVL